MPNFGRAWPTTSLYELNIYSQTGHETIFNQSINQILIQLWKTLDPHARIVYFIKYMSSFGQYNIIIFI